MKAQFFNRTHVFENVAYNIIDNKFHQFQPSVEDLVTQSALLLVGLTSFAANCVLTAAYLRSRTLFNTCVDCLLLNACILGNLVLTMRFFLLIADWCSLQDYLSDSLWIFLKDFWVVFMIAGVLCLFFVLLFWFADCHKPKLFKRLHSNFNYILSLIYLNVLVLMSWHLKRSLSEDLTVQNQSLPQSLLVIVSALYFAYILGMNLYHLCLKNGLHKVSVYTAAGFLVPNLFFVCWLPLLLNMLFAFYYLRVVNLTRALGILNPFLNLAVLYFFDDKYNDGLKALFCGRRRKLDHVLVPDEEP